MSLSPNNLTVIRGDSAAWPLQVYTGLNVVATGVFSALNTLSCELFYGDDAALSVVPQAAWTDAPNAKYVVTITAAQTALLLPGNYTLVVSAAGPNQDPAILEIPLIVQPAPSGMGTLRRWRHRPISSASCLTSPETRRSPRHSSRPPKPSRPSVVVRWC